MRQRRRRQPAGRPPQHVAERVRRGFLHLQRTQPWRRTEGLSSGAQIARWESVGL